MPLACTVSATAAANAPLMTMNRPSAADLALRLPTGRTVAEAVAAVNDRLVHDSAVCGPNTRVTASDTDGTVKTFLRTYVTAVRELVLGDKVTLDRVTIGTEFQEISITEAELTGQKLEDENSVDDKNNFGAFFWKLEDDNYESHQIPVSVYRQRLDIMDSREPFIRLVDRGEDRIRIRRGESEIPPGCADWYNSGYHDYLAVPLETLPTGGEALQNNVNDKIQRRFGALSWATETVEGFPPAVLVFLVATMPTLSSVVSLYTHFAVTAAELKEARERLKQQAAVHLALREKLSHEIRTPLSCIMAMGSLLEQDGNESLTPEQRETLSLMAHSASELASVVNRMVDLVEPTFDLPPSVLKSLLTRKNETSELTPPHVMVAGATAHPAPIRKKARGASAPIGHSVAQTSPESMSMEGDEGQNGVRSAQASVSPSLSSTSSPSSSLSSSPPAEARETSSLRVLAADDNVVNQKVVLRVLRRMGITQVDVVGDGHQAVERERRKEYDLVLMDVHMPVMDGFTAAREILRPSKHRKRPHVVFISAHMGIDTFRREAGQISKSEDCAEGNASCSEDDIEAPSPCVECITKPFSIQKLNAVLRKVGLITPPREVATSCPTITTEDQ